MFTEMTNKELQAQIATYGKRICAIIIDNQRTLFIGYNGSDVKSVADLTFETSTNGQDYMCIHHSMSCPENSNITLTYQTKILTGYIQGLVVMDDGLSANYGADPLMLR
jgi:hypothetical protein